MSAADNKRLVQDIPEGPNGELDWAAANDDETWNDVFEMLATADTCILGRVLYPA